MTRSRELGAVALLCWLAWAAPARATPAALFGPGPRSQALGGTGAASVDTVEAAALNPAGLGGERPQVLLGYRAVHFDLEAEPLGETSDASGAVQFGFSLPLGLDSEDVELCLGMLAATPGTVLVDAHLPPAETPQYPLLLDRAQAIDFSVGAGVRLHRLRLGLGMRVLAGLQGSASVTDQEGETRTLVENTLAPELAPVLGALYALSDADNVALVARAALVADFDVELEVSALQGAALPNLHIGGTAHYDPAELHAEWRHAFGRAGNTRAALGLTYRRWSEFPGWLSQTVSCTEPGCTSLPKESVSLSDTLVPRLGVEHVLAAGWATLFFRAGYFYEPSPLGEQQEAANRWDNDRHALGLGYGVELEPFSLDFAYQLQALVPRAHEKQESVSADNPGYPRVETGGTVQVLSLAFGGTL